MKIINIVGARPNFIKIAPLMEEMRNYEKIKPVLVHTGQHYDYKMSKVFFQDLSIPKPDYNLEVGSNSPVQQISKIMERLEKVLKREKPNLVVVVGDVNSTLAAALVAKKMRIPLAHIESGLRSFDLDMQEEANRILTDHISDYLFVTERSAVENLRKEGIKKEKIFLVGNVMIDTLLKYKNQASKIFLPKELRFENYAVLTLHRPENVDKKFVFKEILQAMSGIQKRIKIIWPIHPRAKEQLKKFGFRGWVKKMKNLKLVSPLGYLEMLSLMGQSKFVLTDSGGIQEETTVLGVPCLTLRKNTERPITIQVGTNDLAGLKKQDIIKKSFKILKGAGKKGKIPALWDGKTSKRIINILRKKFNE
jgi:UDP-N-acetylglucosamine 2-epimerase (non-hydrolysing)